MRRRISSSFFVDGLQASLATRGPCRGTGPANEGRPLARPPSEGRQRQLALPQSETLPLPPHARVLRHRRQLPRWTEEEEEEEEGEEEGEGIGWRQGPRESAELWQGMRRVQWWSQ